MLTSARNNIKVNVKEIQEGAVNSIIKGTLGDQMLQAVVTKEAIADLGLKVGENCHFVFKSSNVIVAKMDLGCIRALSARNQLAGKVSDIKEGAINMEVSATLPCGTIVVAVITKASCEKLELKEGDEVCMIVKASEIMAGVCHTQC